MPDLDHRQLEMLDKMGIDIWRLRQRDDDAADDDATADPAATVAETDDRAAAPAADDDRAAAPTVAEPNAPNAPNAPNTPNTLDTLDKVAMEINQCRRCQLHATRIKAVPGVGSVQAQWMFIGEAPGQNEDQQGLPFVGRAGQLLDAMIAALGMTREQVFIANVIKCRPPANRDPVPEEIAECEPYLHRQLALVKPKVIVALGRVSAQALLKTSESLGHLRGKVHQYGSSNTPLVITYHPAYLLRSPSQKAKSWADLLLARSVVDSAS
ncbi:uracil-DNA glycosylase [Candidatus Spongiihabitans sp.]|uniref:uracil-DNA glycosylase n=1 Tax=Candidatus Spongiihabitans sp. TaxID=3101308 RepID=UPI003C7B03EF